MSDDTNKVNFRTLALSAEIKKIWGPEWNAPEVAYRFSNGREFKLRTGDAAIYAESPVFDD